MEKLEQNAEAVGYAVSLQQQVSVKPAAEGMSPSPADPHRGKRNTSATRWGGMVLQVSYTNDAVVPHNYDISI